MAKAYGIDLEFWPSVGENIMAEKVFKDEMQKRSEYMSKECCIRSALCAVWIAGRKYQHSKDESNKNGKL